MVDLAAIAASPQFQSFAANYLKGLTPSSTPISTYGLLGQGMEGMLQATEKQQKQQMLEKQFGLQEKQVAMQEKKFQQSMEKLRKEQEQQARLQEAITAKFQKNVAPAQQQPAMQASPYGPYASGYGTDEYTPPEYVASQGLLNKRAEQTVPPDNGLLFGLDPELVQMTLMADPSGKMLVNAAVRKAQQKDSVKGFQGAAGDAEALIRLEKEYGADHPAVIQAKEQQAAKIASQRAYANPVVQKTLSSLESIEAGINPSTGKEYANSEQQRRAKNALTFDMMHKTQDTHTRKRAEAGKMLEKTLERIDVQALSQYAGLMGGLTESLDKFQTATGASPAEYKKYIKSLQAMRMAIDQARSYFQDSSSAEAHAHREKLMMPQGWASSPEMAAIALEAMIDGFNDEMDVTASVLTDPDYLTSRPAPRNKERKPPPDVLANVLEQL